jgi:hypothetical protein
MGERPPTLSLERIRNAEGYSKSNCKWATLLEQNNNSRQNVIVEFRGERLTAAQWARRIGISGNLLRQRLNREGMTIEQALTLPVDMAATRRARNKFATLTFRGEKLTYWQWSERTGIGRGTIKFRVDRGWTVERTLTTPARAMRRAV